MLEIDNRFSDDLAEYVLYPSLLDIATGFVQFLVDGDYLPLVYERLLIRAPIPARALSHVKLRDHGAAPREIITCDVSILSEDGVEAVRIEGFSMKRVTEGSLMRRESNPARSRTDRVLTRDAGPGISPRRGAEAFRRVLAGGTVPQIIITARDIQEILDAAQATSRTRLLEELSGASAGETVHTRPPVSTLYTEPSNEIERRIARVWQRVLGIEQVGVNDSFFELGGTSLTGIQLVSELRKEFKVEIPVVSIFEASTVAALAKYLGRQSNEAEVFERAQDRAEKKKRALAGRQRIKGD
jgi:acyl carrier protein